MLASKERARARSGAGSQLLWAVAWEGGASDEALSDIEIRALPSVTE